MLLAHTVILKMYHYLFEDLETEAAGVVVKGASDAHVKGYLQNFGTLTTALVSEWLCSAMSPALRLVTFPRMVLAVQRVVNKAMDAASAPKAGVKSATASEAAAASAAAAALAAATPSAPLASARDLVHGDGLAGGVGCSHRPKTHCSNSPVCGHRWH